MTSAPISRDFLTGALLVGLGLAIASHAGLNYGMGTLRMIGPGAFPVGIGAFLVLFGIIIALADLRGRRDRSPVAPIHWGEVLRIGSAIVSFAILIRPFGVIPAMVALSLFCVLSREKGSLVQALVLSVMISAVALALFKYGLGLRFAALGWPF